MTEPALPPAGTAASVARLAAKLAELGVRREEPFQRPELIAHALTHSSFAAEHGGESNERLEMLGDAALGFAVAELLFELFPDEREGGLTRLRASLVDETMLARVARQLDLGSLLAMGKGEERSGGRDRDSALADALEAIVGALYLSEGFPALTALTRGLFRDEALRSGANGTRIADPKSTLQERSQAAWKIHPQYLIAEESGPAHDRTFAAEVWLGEVLGGRGSGRTKQAAEQAAARAAIARWPELAAEYQARRA
jgi:ribonuclease-3